MTAADLTDSIGKYTLPLIFLMAEIAAAVVLYFSNRKKIRTEKEIKTDRILYSTVAEESEINPQLLLRISDKRAIFVTKAFERMSGMTFAEIENNVTGLKKTMCDGRSSRFIAKYKSWNGSQPLVDEFDSRGRHIKVAVVRNFRCDCDLFSFQDVTLTHNKSKRLVSRLREAEHESISKSEFLSTMSHEIRTPMNGIIGMLTLAQKRLENNSEAYVYLEKAWGLSQYLLSLINDILDMSRIEAGKIELENKAFDIYVMADRIKNMFKQGIEEKGLRFEVETVDFEQRYFMGDEMRINQIVVNILSNAQKFTSMGEVTVTFKLLNFEDGNGDIMIKVHDTGTGMEQSFLEKIFRPFEQENVDVTKKHGGSGLGMTITNRLVTLMNGKIEIDTKVGRGTDFSVYLTLPAADGYDAVEHNDVGESDGSFSYEGLRILLAEDNNINAEIAVEILEADGAMLERAADGRQAVDMYQKHCSGYYDLILMDVQMPVTDGWTAAVRIRHSGKEDSEDIPIYALSADAFIEDKRKSYRCGMNGHFSKPIDFGTLKKGIEADFRRRGRL